MNIKIKDNYIFFLVSIFTVATIEYLSIHQARYYYDGFHIGLLLDTSTDLSNTELLPFKDVFVNYGLLLSYLNSLVLKFAKHDIFWLFVIYTQLYILGILFIGKILIKVTNYKFATLGFLIIFLLHPSIQKPWHNYIIFFIFSFYLLIKLKKSYRSEIFSNFILGSGFLFSETFIYFSTIIFIFDIFFSIKNNFIKKDKNKLIFLKILSYFLPLVIFLAFIYIKSINEYWISHLNMFPKLLSEFYKSNIIEFIIQLFQNFIKLSFTKFFSETYWMVFLIITLTNLAFLLKNLKSKINFEIYFLFLISVSSLLLLYNSLNNFSIFKLATGNIFGLIVLLYVLNNFKYKNLKVYFTIIFIMISFLGYEFNTSNNNQNYVHKYKLEQYKYNKNFIFLKNQKYSIDTWNNLIFFDKTLQKIHLNCKVNYFANLTDDAFYLYLAKKKFAKIQFLPWYKNADKYYLNKYYNILTNHFNPNFFGNLKKLINNKNIIIIVDIGNYPNLRLNNDYFLINKLTYTINLPYSEVHKEKLLVIPNNCKI